MVQLPVRSVSWLVLLSCSTSCPWVVTSTTLFVLASCSFIASSNLAHSILPSLDPLSLLQLTFGDWLLWGFLLGTGLRVADFPSGIFQFWHFPVWASCNLRVFWVMNKYGQWFTFRWWNVPAFHGAILLNNFIFFLFSFRNLKQHSKDFSF